ncbi:MAG: BtrH N-terminal domain-containing protein [Candidatus Hodarchaeota archaeon]
MRSRYIITDFNLFGGLHCETSAVRKIFLYNNLPISEEFLFGLGGGIGFIYWYVKQMPAPMVGGRGGGRYFIENAAYRAGASITVHRTMSSKKGHAWLLEKLEAQQPVVIYADIACLPYTGVPEDAHFGQHALVVYGVDEGANTVYISDRGQRGVTVTVDELKRARASKYPPWPPQHAIFEFSLPKALEISKEKVVDALTTTVDKMLNPPIRNIGLKGIQKWAELILQWPEIFPDERLWQALYQGFIYIETGGSGGSAFRPMFVRYLQEVEERFPMSGLDAVISKYQEAGKIWSKIATRLLPDEYPMLHQVRKWILEQNQVGEEQKPGALKRMLEINHAIDANKDTIMGEVAQAAEFLPLAQKWIIRLYEVEKEAIRSLQQTLKRE